jgi:hypothetical protein
MKQRCCFKITFRTIGEFFIMASANLSKKRRVINYLSNWSWSYGKRSSVRASAFRTFGATMSDIRNVRLSRTATGKSSPRRRQLARLGTSWWIPIPVSELTATVRMALGIVSDTTRGEGNPSLRGWVFL